MAKEYVLADDYDVEIKNLFGKVINLSETSDLVSSGVVFGIIVISNYEDGGITEAIPNLGYSVKICSPKDYLLKQVDAEIFIDRCRWERCYTDIEKIAILHSALNTVDIKIGKDGLHVYQDNGRPKLVKNSPDMVFIGYSNMCKLYETDSPEIKDFRNLKSVFKDELSIA